MYWLIIQWNIKKKCFSKVHLVKWDINMTLKWWWTEKNTKTPLCALWVRRGLNSSPGLTPMWRNERDTSSNDAERLRQTQRQTDRETDRDTDRDTEGQTDTETDRETDRDTDRQRHRGTDRQRDRPRLRQTQRHRQTERQRDRQRHRGTDRQVAEHLHPACPSPELAERTHPAQSNSPPTSSCSPSRLRRAGPGLWVSVCPLQQTRTTCTTSSSSSLLLFFFFSSSSSLLPLLLFVLVRSSVRAAGSVSAEVNWCPARGGDHDPLFVCEESQGKHTTHARAAVRGR